MKQSTKEILLLLAGFVIGLTLGYLIIISVCVSNTDENHEVTVSLPVQPIISLKEENGIFYSNDYLLRYTQEDIDCLTANIFFEAGNQSRLGKMTVGQVTINRQRTKRFPNTICGVITAGKYRNDKIVKNKCAFSWFCDGLDDRPNLKNKIVFNTWEISEEIAKIMLKGDIRLNTKATHYHTTGVLPYWVHDKRMVKLRIVDDHVTYYEKS